MSGNADARARLDAIYDALTELRVPAVPHEKRIQDDVARLLLAGGYEFAREAAIAPRCRADFLVGDVLIEIKKGKPDKKTLRAQLERYAESPLVGALLLVVERTADAPSELSGKPARTLRLNRLWGVSLP